MIRSFRSDHFNVINYDDAVLIFYLKLTNIRVIVIGSFDEMFSLQVILLSMRDMNIAKLTSQDLPLFLGIVQDLFPGVETPVIDYGKVCINLLHVNY